MNINGNELTGGIPDCIGELILLEDFVFENNFLTGSIPEGIGDLTAYDGEKYVRSQVYLKARTRFGLFSSTFSLGLILIVIHSDVFGYLDQYVRLQTENYILQGLLFIGIIYFFQDIISLPFSLYNTFVIEQKFGFNKVKPGLFFIVKI